MCNPEVLRRVPLFALLDEEEFLGALPRPARFQFRADNHMHQEQVGAEGSGGVRGPADEFRASGTQADGADHVADVEGLAARQFLDANEILVTLIELDSGQQLPVGLRVDAFIDARAR